ncbi:helicase [Mycolicibacterium sp. 018/SC-01/001]|uniref:DEAD/DEAH box helicase n=1 Tax=Mycolicibacterium sp. 018/SC-01/001 TaxID=2592069 RepID=UPI00117D30E9|nr:DEAD/DEAH box helicase [Mycolicibacterium sp. 018/SC-01/001]TRW79285.1 helicase [Mycolicibacterium sp. 018/SC-01/001]
MGEFSSLYERLDADPRLRGRQFERICQWWLANDPTYKRTIRRVWLWGEWEHNWGADAGIDLVAEDFDGRLWAIQAKAYNAAHAVTKSDVDRFLSESSRKWFDYRLLIATTDKMHHVARRTINDQEKQVSFVGLSDLLTSAVDWPTDPARMRPSRVLKAATPRAHQRAAIRDVVKGFKSSDRGQLIMACGTGKTLTSLFISEKLGAGRTLVLVPSLSLLKQTMQVWQLNAKVPFEARPVCSDLTVVGCDDEAVAHASELGVPVTTDPVEIAAFLRRRSGRRVVFSTYQSSPQIAKAFALGRVPQFDLVIADESHRVAGDESTTFATVLDASAIRARRRLFMTATPRFYTGRVIRAAQESEMEVASMDDPAKFGKVFHRLGFGEAIRQALLTDYQVAIVGVDDATYRDWANRGVLVRRDEKTTDARTLASQIGLAKAMKKYQLHRVISFHSRVLRAKRFADELPDVIEWMPSRQRPSGSLWTGFASGEMSAGERHVRLLRLSSLEDGERGLLSNARCLSEGVDVPTLDGVAFIDPRGSEVDIVQAVGRAIRLAEDKSIGTIVIPVFIDTMTDPDTALNDSSFRSVWRVVNALRAHDEELAEQIDAYRRELGRRGSARIPRKIHLDIGRTVGKAFGDAFNVRLVERTSARWEFWYGLLERYADEIGTARVPVDHVVDDYPLGQWASVQRGLYSKGDLRDDRTQKLESLSGWTWDIAADQWGMWMALMHEFVAKHGHADVPIPFMVGEYNLRSWVATQRGLQKSGKLSDDRVRELEALPGWVWDKREDKWTRHYEGLKKFSMRTGHARAPQRYVEDGLRLGQWVVVQRNYRQEMSPERKTLLEALPGWSWNPTTDGWERSYSFLTNFVEREGHARVAKDHLEGGMRLGQWVNDQRGKRDKLSADHHGRLESLPGWVWNLRSDKWHTKFALLQQFQRREGHALVPQRWREDGVNLGSWVAEQRNNQADMSSERRQLLESVPGWAWDPYTESWERGYTALVAFAKEQGHARVPQGLRAGGINLGGWVAEQRTSRSKMTAARLERLEAVPGWSWNAVEDSWNQHLELLRTYAAREGDTNVPVDYVENGLKLGQWTRLRRREHKQLSADRQVLLESIPGWFWGRKADYIWNQKYEILQRFVEREGHALVPDQYVNDGVKLGGWVREQRAERDNLPIERAARLEALPGWSWAVSVDSWFEKYELVRGFADRKGHSRVPQSHKEQGVALGSWIAVQRGLRNTMSRERRALLELLPGWSWDPHEDRWQRSYLLVQQFGAREGHTRVPDRHIEDRVNIGSWVLTQRINRDQLSQNRVDLLESLPGWVWDAYAHRWDRGYGRLVEYVKENGTSQVPFRYVTEDGFQLGAWVNTVRSRKRTGSLSVANSKQMASLPDWSWTPKADRWERAYSLLMAYVEERGDALVPQSYVADEFSLGAWVAAQRRHNAAGTLASDRQKRLGKAKGWVWRVK